MLLLLVGRVLWCGSYHQLLPIGNCPAFEDGLIDTVNARDLHAALEIKTHFKDWIARRLAENLFAEGVDYTVLKNERVGIIEEKNYFISLDMAKHLAMLEKNHQGKKVRAYFIEHEKQARAIMPPSLQAQVAAAVAKAMEPVMTQVGSLTKALEDAAPKAPDLPPHSRQSGEQSPVQVRGPERPRGDDRGQAAVRGGGRVPLPEPANRQGR